MNEEMRLTLVGEPPNWKEYFERQLGFEVSKDNAHALFIRLNINCKTSNTVWCNIIPDDYPELRPVSIEVIKLFEECMYGYPKDSNKSFTFTSQQIDYMTGKPTLFDRGQGATTAFISLLLLQKGQPLILEKDPRGSDLLCIHYKDYKGSDVMRRSVHFASELKRIHDYVYKHKGERLIRDILVIQGNTLIENRTLT